jgi:iron complex transport system substrate-binding protein
MRVVSLVPAVTDWISVFGAADRLVGCSHVCRQPGPIAVVTRPIELPPDSAGIDAAIREAGASGDPVIIVEVEQLLDLEPDLIVVQDTYAVCSVDGVSLETLLSECHDQPEILSFSPSTVKEILDGALRIGRHLGVLESAMRWISDQEVRLAHLRTRIGVSKSGEIAGGSRARVVVLEWIDPPMTAGHWIPDMVELAGADTLLASPDGKSVATSWEIVAASEPDVLLVASCGRTVAESSQDLASSPGWRQLPTLLRDRTWILDGTTFVTTPGPSLYRAIQLVASVIYPERAPMRYEPWELQQASAQGN